MNIRKTLNQPYYPFQLSGILLAFATLLLLFFSLIGNNPDLIVLAAGTELFLYILANSISALVVDRFESYVGKTVLAYVLNLIVLFLLIMLFSGGIPDNLKETYQVYLALIISFMLSLGIIILIRQVLSFLKEK